MSSKFGYAILIACTLALAACGGSPRTATSASATAPDSSEIVGQTYPLGNNTSAADSFATQKNGNAGSGNVSKVSVRSALALPSVAKIYAHLMVWFGKSNHMNVGYDSADASQVHRQLDDMASRGIQGAIIDWYGTDPSHSHEDRAATAVMQDAGDRSGFEFAIMEDAGGGPMYCAQRPGCNVTQQVISDLNYVAQHYETSPAYMKINGRPAVFFFGLEQFSIDWNAVRRSVANNPVLIFRNAVGFDYPQTNGGFSWVNITPGNPSDWGQNYLDSFYAAGLQHGNQTVIGSAYKGFNDKQSGWSTNRVVNQQCGHTWLNTLDEIGKYYGQNPQLAGVQLVTWNDYEEGSEIESGIQNCVSVSAKAHGNSVQWSLHGDESTVDHYSVWSTSDGANFKLLGDVSTGTYSFDLASAGVAHATRVAVQAVGKPSLTNHLSGLVQF